MTSLAFKMQYTWKLDHVARLMAHKHYLEDTVDEIVEQKNIAVHFLRDKLHAIGEMRVYDDNHVEYMDEEGEEKEFRWDPTTRNGQELSQFLTPLKRYRWFEEEWRRTEERLKELLDQITNNEE